MSQQVVKNVTVSTPGPMFLLFLVFLVLKLVGTISWSWWLVTLPLWGIPALLLGVGGICLVVALIIAAIAGIVGLFASKSARKNIGMKMPGSR